MLTFHLCVCVEGGLVLFFFPVFLDVNLFQSGFRSAEKHVSIGVFERYLSHACEHRQEAKLTIR